MSGPKLELSEALDKKWDVIVVGTGVGGGTVGYALAQRGKSVLFVEKGHFLFDGFDRGDGSMSGETDVPAQRLNEGWWPQQIQGDTSYARQMSIFFPMGCGTGGSSSLYGAQLERMLPADFEPKRYHSGAKGANLPEAWPVEYSAMLPYYRQAEALYEVVGTDDPLNPDPQSNYGKPPAMSQRDEYVWSVMQKADMSPYRAHVGCRYKPGCKGCGAALCPRECKTDSALVAIKPAVKEHGAYVLADAEVLKLEADARRVNGVKVNCKGTEGTLTADIVVVAAGTLMTPTLMLKSASEAWPDGLANRSGMVGRNLMMHTSDFIALRPGKSLDPTGPDKTIASTALYTVGGKKLGAFQSVGIPVTPGSIDAFLRGKTEKDPKWYLKAGGAFGRKVASRVGAKLFEQADIYASIVEDLPYADNRVYLDASAKNGMRFNYTYPDELRERNELFRKELERRLGKSLKTLVLGGDNNLNYGHVSGTMRAGHDAETCVVDANHRAHDLENLYVADASAFPMSGGINPSLTIAASSLRVAEAIAG